MSKPQAREPDDPTPEIERPWLTPGVRGIGAASLLSDLGHEVPTSLLPRFLTQTVGAPAAALGIIEGVADGLAGLARLLGGSLADDPQRRRGAAVGGYAATAVLTSAIGLATAPWQVGALRAGGWFARGLRVPARNALLADAVPPGAYGRAYGFERAMDNLGAILGPLLALVLVALFDVRTAIMLSVIPGLLATVAIVYAIRHLRQETHGERRPLRLRIRPVLRGRLGRLMTAVGLFEVGNIAATLLILRATELLVPSRGLKSATFIALLLYVTYNVAATVTSLVAGHASDRTSATRVLGAGVGAFLASYALFAFTGPSITLLAGGFLLAGVGIGCVETAEHASVAMLAPEALRGSAFGLLATVQSLGNLVASAGAGILWSVASPDAAFTTLMGVMAAALLALAGLSRARVG